MLASSAICKGREQLVAATPSQLLQQCLLQWHTSGEGRTNVPHSTNTHRSVGEPYTRGHALDIHAVARFAENRNLYTRLLKSKENERISSSREKKQTKQHTHTHK